MFVLVADVLVCWKLECVIDALGVLSVATLGSLVEACHMFERTPNESEGNCQADTRFLPSW